MQLKTLLFIAIDFDQKTENLEKNERKQSRRKAQNMKEKLDNCKHLLD